MIIITAQWSLILCWYDINSKSTESMSIDTILRKYLNYPSLPPSLPLIPSLSLSCLFLSLFLSNQNFKIELQFVMAKELLLYEFKSSAAGMVG